MNRRNRIGVDVTDLHQIRQSPCSEKEMLKHNVLYMYVVANSNSADGCSCPSK
jgi:hypothetical protein